MAKGTSFAEKAKRGAKKEKEFTVVKLVKSVVSEKTGHYRFQESMLKVPAGKSVDAYLKELESGPIEELEEVSDAQKPESGEPQLEEVEEPGDEPAGEKVEAETSEVDPAEISDEEEAPNEENAEGEEGDTEAEELVDELQDVDSETTEEESVEEFSEEKPN